MGWLYGNNAMYKVQWWESDEDNDFFKAFKGDRAFTEANELFEEKKKQASICELWLLRLDGDKWENVTSIKRDEKGTWQTS